MDDHETRRKIIATARHLVFRRKSMKLSLAGASRF
jgi:hypothetical protein